MKVAVCISGQLRTFRKTYESIYKNVIKQHNADVFIHSWKEHGTSTGYDKTRTYEFPENSCDVALDLYKPTMYMFDDVIDFSEHSNLKIPLEWQKATAQMNPDMTLEEATAHSIQQTCSMFYSIHKCNELKEQYSQEHGFTYDAVIRLRFDIQILSPIPITQFDLSKVYYHELHQPDRIISDWINIGNNNVMNIYASVYNNIYILNALNEQQRSYPITFRGAPDCIWGPEHLIREIMAMKSVKASPYTFDLRLIYK